MSKLGRGRCDCCVEYPDGFDVYGLIHIGAFTEDGQSITRTGQLTAVTDNWFVDYLTRANILGVGADGPATPLEVSTEFDEPLDKPVTKPAPPDTDFAIGNFVRTAVNTVADLVAWYGEYAVMSYVLDGSYVLRRPTEGEATQVVIITTTDGELVAQYTAVDPAAYTASPLIATTYGQIIPGWNRSTPWYMGMAFDADRSYTNPCYWLLPDPSVDVVYWDLSENGAWGVGVLGAGFVNDFDNSPPVSYGYLREGTYPYYAKTGELAALALDLYVGGPTGPKEIVIPGNWQAWLDERGQAWATVMAACDPSTAFGYGVAVTAFESPTTGQTSNTTYTNQNWCTAYARSLYFGDVDSDGLVVGSPIWSSGAYQLVGDPPVIFIDPPQIWHGMTAAGLECDSWGETRAGIFFTSALTFEHPGKGSRTRTSGEWSANVLPIGVMSDYGDDQAMVDQLNDPDVTRDPEEALIAVVINDEILFSHAFLHPGWKPQSIRVAHDGTGDVFIAEQYTRGGISPYTISANVADGQHGLGIENVSGSADRSINLGGTSGNRVGLIAAYKGALASVRVTNTLGSSTGSHTVLESGTIGDWTYQLIECNTTSTNARVLRGQRTTAGLLALAWINNSVTGVTAYTVGAVGATPSTPPPGYAAAQVCLAASPIAATTQQAKIQLAGQGRPIRKVAATGTTDQAVGVVTGLSHVWDSALDNAWTFGSEVEGTIGYTILTALPDDTGWNIGENGSGAGATQNPSTIQGQAARLRRVTPEGETKWVVRGLKNNVAPIQFANSDELIVVATQIAAGSYTKLMLAIDAVTGEARQFNYPDDAGTGAGWYADVGLDDPITRWAFVPTADEMSTKDLATWIAASPVALGTA